MAQLHQAVSCRCGNEHDIVLGRQAVRRMAQELGFSLVDQTKMVTAASELARNALIYGGGGITQVGDAEDGVKRGLRLTFRRSGPRHRRISNSR